MNNNCQVAFTTIDIISIITLICNILLFIINMFIVLKSKSEDIKRSIDLNFYELTLVKSLKEYLHIIGMINKNHSDLINEYTKTDDAERCRILAEDSIKNLDDMYEKCENEISPFLFGFSTNVGDEIHEIFEKYYDDTTKILSEYSQPSMNSAKQSKIHKSYTENMKKIISDIHSLIKGYCPK